MLRFFRSRRNQRTKTALEHIRMNAIISLCHFCEIHGPSILFCTQAFHTRDPQQVLGHEGGGKEEVHYASQDCSDLSSRVSSTDGMETPTTPTSLSSLTKDSDQCEACQSFPSGTPGFISNDHDARVSYVSSQHPHHPQVFSMVRQACLRSLSCEVCPGREGPIFFGDDHRGHVLSHTFFVQDAQARGLQRWYSILVVMMDKIYLLNSWPFLIAQTRHVIDRLQEKAKTVYAKEHLKCPPRVHRLNLSMNPSNFLQQRGGANSNKTARSLVELTNDQLVFCKLHRAFTWILKAGGNRLTERLLEGPPTEDSIIDFEKQEETEEGFVKLFSKKDVLDESLEEGDADDLEPDLTSAESWNEGCPKFTSLRHLLRILGYMEFHTLAHHAIIGNQVIIRGRQRGLVRSTIDCLKDLLPKGCCRAIYYSSTYIDSWRCNFLGMRTGSSPPKHASLYVTLDIEEPGEPIHDYVTSVEDVEDVGMEGAEATKFDPERDPLLLYTFSVSSPMCMPEKAPAVLCQIEQALLNEQLADTVVEHCLVSLKEEWMNKVKVLFKFTKAGGSRSEDDTRRLLQVVEANEEDKAILKFWMTGLSVQYRNHMLSSAIHQAVNG